MEEPHDDATTGDDFTYAYKSSLMGAPFEFRLASDALEWSKGETKGRMSYRRIQRVRLGLRPMTMQNHRFLAEIWRIAYDSPPLPGGWKYANGAADDRQVGRRPRRF